MHNNESRTDRLVLAAVEHLSERGVAMSSTRSIASASGMAASAINYNFGGIEQLFSAAFLRGATQTAEWLTKCSKEILALPRTPEGAVYALEYLLAGWTMDARPLALLYQECLAMTAGRGAGETWTGLWRAYWLQTAAAFGLSQIEGRLLHLFFESEALYQLSTWSPALEGAALREMCGHFGTVWLGSANRLKPRALGLAERTAGARSHGSIAPSALRIAESAAGVMEMEGLGGLTHRAVAARAGVTTGAVTHHFRTIEDLVAGAIRGQVQAMNRDLPGVGPSPAVDEIQTVKQLFDALRNHALADRPTGPALRRRLLFLAAVRRTDLASSSAVIRYSYGGTVRNALGRIFQLPADTLAINAGVLARLVATVWYACSADPSPREARKMLIAEILVRFSRHMGADEQTDLKT